MNQPEHASEAAAGDAWQRYISNRGGTNFGPSQHSPTPPQLCLLPLETLPRQGLSNHVRCQYFSDQLIISRGYDRTSASTVALPPTYDSSYLHPPPPPLAPRPRRSRLRRRILGARFQLHWRWTGHQHVRPSRRLPSHRVARYALISILRTSDSC